jgi:cytidyltransferase-like protein
MDEQMQRPAVFVLGGFDDLRTIQIRFLQEADKLGDVHVLLVSDKAFEKVEGKVPKFNLEERRYYLEAIRYIKHISVIDNITIDAIKKALFLKLNTSRPKIWAYLEKDVDLSMQIFCKENSLKYEVIPDSVLVGFPVEQNSIERQGGIRKKVMVSGCFDWLHSGHVRFFEEVSAFGDLYVVVGSDENLRLLKGEEHPLFPQEERLYWVQAIRFVKKAVISTGSGWLDAEPEILAIKPDIFVVNTDGDVPEKQAYFKKHNIEYKVLKRKPKSGLPARVSTDLRGF